MPDEIVLKPGEFIFLTADGETFIEAIYEPTNRTLTRSQIVDVQKFLGRKVRTFRITVEEIAEGVGDQTLLTSWSEHAARLQ